MAQRGGGIQDIVGRFVENRHGKDVWLVVHVEVDVCEAMGANVVNTVCEGLAPSIQSLIGGRIGLRILSNLCTERRTKVCFKMPIDKLQWKGTCGELVSKKVLEAYHFADSDHFRATTNNKGIMNGIDAVAIATGQDWRAIEAGAHSFACITGRYRSLSRYWVEGDYFFGEMELPISVGTKGGAVTSHPLYKLSLEMLGNPDCQTLSQIMVAIGLAQNFAAIRALAIEGIQKGHMSLHARNIAVAADVPEHLVSAVVAKMCASHQVFLVYSLWTHLSLDFYRFCQSIPTRMSPRYSVK
jgi:hydroxymethylglutaryl-CoA synthase